MIKTRKDLKFYIQEDAKRNGYYGRYIAYIAGLLVGKENAYIFKYLKLLRHAEYHYNNRRSIFHKCLYYYYKIRQTRLGLKLKVSIHLNECGYGLRIMHLSGGGGVRLGAKKIGNYCGFNAGCLVGTNGPGDTRPTIGDYVAFGPGAKAFGKITIGDNVFVAANSVVTKDVNSNNIVGGVPAKLIKETKIEDNVVFKKFSNKCQSN